MKKSRRELLKQAALASTAVAAPGLGIAQLTGGYKRIAAEETFAVPEVVDALRELLEQEPDREPGLNAPPYIVTDTIRALYDLGEGRLAAMDA